MLGNKKSISRLTYIVPVFVLVVVASLLVVNVTPSAAHKQYIDHIDWSLVPSLRTINLSAGSNETIPINLIAPQNEELNLKTGVTVPTNAVVYKQTGIDKLPNGIMAKLDRQSINLSAESTTGNAIRDKLNLSISVSQDANPGKYLICLLAYEDNGKGSCRGLYINVEK